MDIVRGLRVTKESLLILRNGNTKKELGISQNKTIERNNIKES